MSFVSPLGMAGKSGIQEVWQWRSDCDQPTILRVEVLTETVRLLETRLLLCRGVRESAALQRNSIEFPASSMADRLGASQDTATTGDVWVAGGEPDGVVLGISFQTEDRVLLNTLRFVPAVASQTDLMRGVRLVTAVE